MRGWVLERLAHLAWPLAAVGMVSTGGCGHDRGGAPQAPPVAATGPPAPAAASVPASGRDSDRVVAWAQVWAEIEALICMKTFEIEGRPPFEEPIYGHRDACDMPPPETPLQRAVQTAYEDAGPMLAAMRHEWFDAVLAATTLEDPDARLPAARAAYLQDRFVAVLVASLLPALRQRGLTCDGCPAPIDPPGRTITWDTFVPYFGAYTWPDPIVTRSNDDEPRFGMHICIGTNGVSQLPDPDGALVELGFLVALHTPVVRTKARAHYDALRTEESFTRLRDDDTRTRFARDNLGPRVASDPEVRTAACKTVERFRPVTGITIAECGATGD